MGMVCVEVVKFDATKVPKHGTFQNFYSKKTILINFYVLTSLKRNYSERAFKRKDYLY
jgi:hypothetical protein